jgi:SpoVK/Ycf46/Vps4 family AAA+-type ATPase
MCFKKDLELLVKSSCSLIYILTSEEERLEYMLKDIVSYDISQSIYFWDFVDGYGPNFTLDNVACRNPLQALNTVESFNSNYDAIFVLRDFNYFFSDIAIVRKIRNLSRKLELKNQTVVITALELKIPLQLQELVTVLRLPFPNKYEIQLEVSRLLNALNKPFDNILLEQVAISCQGLSITQVRTIISRIMVSKQRLDLSSLKLLILEKQKNIKEISLLELCNNNISLEDIGGIDVLKEWLNLRSKAFSWKSIHYGLPYPKGILLIGIQGTGKSMSAKATASVLGLPLLKLDVGKLFAGLVGESERNVRNMIQIAEAYAPCVLWIDEIDKAFSGTSNSGDSGTTSRVLSTLLTWLAEKETAVFIVATANNITSLPAEVIRKGRFDEIFFLDLPNIYEREMIFQVNLVQLRPKTWHRYNLVCLAKYSHSFSGAEIRQVILEGMHLAFCDEREFQSNDILNAINSLVPLAFIDQSNIKKLQEWASLGKSRLASKYYKT